MTTTTTTLATKAIDAGIGSAWTHPRTGEVRVYINEWHALAGIEISHYKTGNISSAAVDGEHVSNSAASQLPGKVWIVDNTVCVAAAGRKSPLTSQEIGQRVKAALTR